MTCCSGSSALHRGASHIGLLAVAQGPCHRGPVCSSRQLSRPKGELPPAVNALKACYSRLSALRRNACRGCPACGGPWPVPQRILIISACAQRRAVLACQRRPNGLSAPLRDAYRGCPASGGPWPVPPRICLSARALGGVPF